MTLREQAERHRALLLAVLDDATDVRRIPADLVAVAEERGLDASAAALFILTGLVFDERQARRHWDAIVDDLQELRATLRRHIGLRTAVLDYFVNIHPRFVMATFVGGEPATDSVEPARPATWEQPLVGAGRFRESVDYEVGRARRYGGTAGVVLADLDGFAAIDRTLGRTAAERVLVELGNRLCSLVREYDCVARPGEDEFAMLLPGADREETAALAHRFRRIVTDPVTIDGVPPVELTTSVGLAVFPGDAPAADSLLERAAHALYEAKRRGGDTVVTWRAERRRHLRRGGAVGWNAMVRALDGAFGCVELSDVSRDGVAFYSETPFDLGAEIEVSLGGRVRENEPESQVRRRGVVVHLADSERAPGDGVAAHTGYRVGVAFNAGGARPRPVDGAREG